MGSGVPGLQYLLHVGFSSCGSWALEHRHSSCGPWLVACGIFPDQGSNHVSCIGRWILYHWATRKGPSLHFWKESLFSCHVPTASDLIFSPWPYTQVIVLPSCVILPFTTNLHSLASLVAQMVKNLPAMQESQVQSLGQEDPWKRKWQSSAVFFPRKFHGQRNLEGYSPWDHKVGHD